MSRLKLVSVKLTMSTQDEVKQLAAGLKAWAQAEGVRFPNPELFAEAFLVGRVKPPLPTPDGRPVGPAPQTPLPPVKPYAQPAQPTGLDSGAALDAAAQRILKSRFGGDMKHYSEALRLARAENPELAASYFSEGYSNQAGAFGVVPVEYL